MPDVEVRRFVEALASEITTAAGVALVDVYLHGSPTVGDWIPGVSDIDLLVVVRDDATPDTLRAVAARLRGGTAEPGRRDRGLGRGTARGGVSRTAVALSRPRHHRAHRSQDRVVCARARRPRPRPPLRGYAHARLGGVRTAVDRGLRGDFRHRRARANGRRAPLGRRTHAARRHAVLNACRALRFHAERALGSKSDSGRWALERDIEPALVRTRRSTRAAAGRTPPVDEATTAWVLGVAVELDPD